MSVILETGKRLSESLVWDVQRAYFESRGAQAWRSGAVPHYVTSNPYIAHAYARLVTAWLRDSAPAIDPAAPVYVVELGSGCGKFAHHFLRQLEQVRAASGGPHPRITYVMTDVAGSNIEAWEANPALVPVVESGRLDFARFGSGQQGPLRLLHSGEVLAPGAVTNPLVVIANYVFDCMPHDVFGVHGGILHEGRVTTTSSQEEPDPAAPGLMGRLELTYEYLPVDGAPYGDPDLDAILAAYCDELGDSPLLLPVGALASVRAFAELSAGRMLLLCADKGFHWGDDVAACGHPGMVLHDGCFSMSVNFDAVARYVTAHGGEALFASRRYTSLGIAAFALDGGGHGTGHVRETFADAVERFGPDEYASLVAGLASRAEGMPLEELLAWLRFSRADVDVLTALLPALAAQAPAAPEPLREDLYALLREVLTNDFEIGAGGTNTAFAVGSLLYGLGYYPEARDLLAGAVERNGPDSAALYNLGLCHWALGAMAPALACVDRLLDLDPVCAEGKALRVRLTGAARRRPQVLV